MNTHNRFLAVLGTFLFIISMSAPALSDSAYIDVSGQGELDVYPDFLTLSVELSATEKDVVRAKNKVDDAFAQLSKVAEEHGIAEDDIESVRISNYPQWEYQGNGKRELIGHRVIRPVTITLRTLDKYGPFLEEVLIDERYRIQNTSLGFDKPAEHESKARRLALLDAKAKAEEMAATLGQKVTGVLWIQEQAAHFPQPVMMMESAPMMRSAKVDSGSSMKIQEQTISQQVQVRFEMEED